MSQNNGACPIVPWETQYDQDQQRVWCPIAQEQNYNLLDVFTGGNDPRLNKMLNVEGFSYLAQYRTVPQLDRVLSGPICMSANPPCFTKQPTTEGFFHAGKMMAPRMMTRNGMMSNGNMKPDEMYKQNGGCGVRENYCGCTTKQVALSGVNQIPYR